MLDLENANDDPGEAVEGEDAVNPTVPVKPPLAVIVIVDVPEFPAWIVRELGSVAIEKSPDPAAVTVMVTTAGRVRPPPVPITVKV